MKYQSKLLAVTVFHVAPSPRHFLYCIRRTILVGHAEKRV
jgi:hypothetical protein